LLIVGAAVIWQFINVRGGQQGGGNLKEITIGDAAFFVEIADTPATRTKGLSGHKQLKENEGMLFIFDSLGQYSFWMKDMNSPLDIIWIKENKVVGFAENAPPAGNAPLTIYTPPQPVDKVLEINAGSIKKLGIKIGDTIEF